MVEAAGENQGLLQRWRAVDAAEDDRGRRQQVVEVIGDQPRQVRTNHATDRLVEAEQSEQV